MKRYNIPEYMYNLKRSGKHIAKKQFDSYMPTLSDTIVSAKNAFNEFKSFDRIDSSQYGLYIKRRRNIFLGPLKDFIRNAKEDLKSGKIYNEERVNENSFGSYNGLEDMIDGFYDDDIKTVDGSEFENVSITSKFDKQLKSVSSSLGIRNKALSDSLNSVNIDNTDYIANVNTINSTKFMTLTTKHHMEQMKQLKNIENIGMSIVKFNQDVVASAIERQDRFHEDILNETRELKEAILKQTEFNMARFKSGSKPSSSYSPLEAIIGDGKIDIKEYIANIKKNFKGALPLDKSMFEELFKGVTSSPISSVLNVLASALIPKDVKKGMKNLDNSIINLFSSYLLGLNNLKYNGKNSLARRLAEMLGVNLNTYNKPNLSIYKDQDMTLEIEQKKAKAITEVIPSYLSKMTEAMTGITKTYDYTRGVFVDKTKRRKEINQNYKNNILSDMYDTRDSFENQYKKYMHILSRKESKYIEEDIRNFIAYLGMSSKIYDPDMSYSQLKRRGLRLKGGETSYNIIRRFYLSMSNNERGNIRTEQLKSISARPGLNGRFDMDLQSSGDSAIFNGMDEYDEDGNLITTSYTYGRGIPNRRNKRSKYELIRRKNKKDDKNKRNSGLLNSISEDAEAKVDNILVKALSKIGIKTGAIVTLLTGLNDSIYGLIDTDGKSPTEKVTNFMSSVLNSIKYTIFGKYDMEGNVEKEGILPKKISDKIKEYLPKTRTGAIVGGLAGLTLKHPILGAVAGSAINILMETEKVKKFLWGDPDDENNNGLFGGLKNKINEKFINPIKSFLKDKIDNTKDTIKDKVDNFFGINNYDYYDKKTKRYKAIGKNRSISEIVKSFKNRSNFQTGIVDKITGELERGIYSSQLDTIIALLSGGFGYVDVNGKPNNPNNNESDKNIDTKTSFSSTSNIKQEESSVDNSVDKKSVGRASMKINTNKYRNKSLTMDPIQAKRIEDMIDGTEFIDTIVPFSVNNVYERAIYEELKKDPEFVKRIKEVANDMLPDFKEKLKNIKESEKIEKGKKKLGDIATKFKTRAGSIDFDKIKSTIMNNIALNGIGKGRGVLIGLALGGMALGNPLLGAVAGLTFAKKSDKQKELEKEMGGNQYKPGRTAAKYGLLTTLLGLGPMPGILLGALMPQRKNKEPNILDKIFGESSKKGKAIGALAGLMLGGGIPGMLLGGALGGRIIGKKRKISKNDYDVKNEIIHDPETGEVTVRKRTPSEIKWYMEMKKIEEKERKRAKTAKGTPIDMLTGGGKLSTGMFGSLAGLMLGGGIPGMLLGGLGGSILSTSRSKLNRNMTGGILQNQGKWRSAVIGALIGNVLMGPLLGTAVGGLAGSILGRGPSKKFWRYDKNGNLLSKYEQQLQKQAFKKEYKYKRNTEWYNLDKWLYDRALVNGQRDIGPEPDINDWRYDTNEKRSIIDQIKTRREIIKRENAIRDENAKKLGLNKTDKKFNLENLEIFNQSKSSGLFKGAAAGTQFFGPFGTLLGGALGFLTSGKRKQPDGTKKRPFFVKNVNDEAKDKDNPHGYDKKDNDKFNKQNKRNIEKLKNADNKNGDRGAEDVLKDTVDDIQKSSMKSEHKERSMNEVTQYVTAMKTGSSSIIGNGSSGKGSSGDGGFIDDLLGSMLGPVAGKILGNIFRYAGPIALTVAGGYDIYNHLKNDEYDLAAETGGDITTNWIRKISKSTGKLGTGLNSLASKALSGVKNIGRSAWNATGGRAISAIKGSNVMSGIKNTSKSIWGATGGKVTSFIKGFKGNSLNTLAKNVTSDAAVNAVTNSADSLTKGSVKLSGLNTIKTTFANALKKISESSIVKKLAPSLATKLSGISDNIATKIFNTLAKNGDSIAKAVAASTGEATTKTAVKAIPYAGWIITGIQAIYDFISGWNDVGNILQTDTTYEPPTGLKFTSGILKCLIGIIPWVSLFFDITGLRPTIVELIYSFFASDDEMADLKESQASANANYEEFVRLNPGTTLTRDKYNEITNKSTWGKITSFFGFGNSLDDYRTTDAKLSDNIINNTSNPTTSSIPNISDISDSGMNGISTTNNILLGIYESVNSLAGGAYVVQNNQKTVNISGGSYDSSISAAEDAMNTMTGGRGSDNSFKSMVPKSLFKNTRNKIPQISAPALRRYNKSSGRGTTVNNKLKRYGGRGVNGDKIVQDAMKYIGLPYKWGASGPSEFDCSGLVYYVFKQNGINVPRTSKEQSKFGTQVDKADLKPGDCVFFAKNGSVHHVGIYIGDDQFIHSPSTGDVIKISSLSSKSDFYCARRFVDPGNGSYSAQSSTSSSNNTSTISNNLNSSFGIYNTSNGKSLLQSRAKKPKVSTISSNSDPEETILEVTSNKDVQNILQTAYENNENFMNDSNISNNKNIKKKKHNKEETSKSFASKVINGLKNAGSWAWDKIKQGASWIGGKISGAFKWLTGGRGDSDLIDDPDYYNQQDSRWSNMSFGMYNNHRDTVGDGGCGPTTAATVLQKLTGQNITPAETSKFALKNGYKVDDGGTTPDYFNALGSKYGVSFNQSDPYSNETISSLKQGKPVIFLGHDSTGTSPFGTDSHYVVGTGIDKNGNIAILDPKNKMNNRTYNINDIASNAFQSIVPNKTGGRGKSKKNKPKIKRISKKQIMMNESHGDDTGLHQKMMKNGMLPTNNNGRGKNKNSKYFKLLGGRSGSINIIEESYDWASKLSTRSQTNYIALHHAAAVNCTCQDIHRWHLANGWSGIGYHFVVYKDGSIHRARPLDALGAHVKNANSDSIGICAVGNYDNEDKTMPDAQFNSIVNLCKYLKGIYPNAKVVGHKEIGASDCPGRYYPLDKIKEAVGDGGCVTANTSSNSSSSSSTGTTITSSSGGLIGKLSGILNALTPTTNIISNILNTAYSAYDSNSESSTNTSSTTNSSGKSVMGIVAANDMGQQVNIDQAYNRDPRSFSKITEQQLKDAINEVSPGSYLADHASNIMKASEKTGLDPRFITAFAAQESGWHGSAISKDKNNYFGIGAQDHDPYNTAYAFSSPADGFTEGMEWILDKYIEAGQNTLYKFNRGAEFNQRGESWRNYNTGGLDGMYDYAVIYKSLINATGGAGSRGGRGNSNNKFLKNKLSKPIIKNPFVKNKYNKTGRGLNNKKSKINNSSQHKASIMPIVSKYSSVDYMNKSNYGGRGITPIPSTSSVIDALSLKSTNSIIESIDNAIKPSEKEIYNVNTVDSAKLDEGNKINTAILTVLKSIASTLERIERNSAIQGNNFNNISYSNNSGELTSKSYKAAMMNNIVSGN